MLTNIEFKAFMQKHETEILNNDWTAIYSDFSKYDNVPKLTDFLLNKAHINPLYYMTSVPEDFARELDITSITIPRGVTSIGSYAFQNCTSLTSITISSSVTSIGYCAFYCCTGLTSITIPSSVTSIGESAFDGCTGLTSITIPSSVTSIDDCAFYYCTGLTSITIPNSVMSIGGGVFYNCSKLNEINYIGTQQQWNKLLATSEDFVNWIRINKVKVNLI